MIRTRIFMATLFMSLIFLAYCSLKKDQIENYKLLRYKQIAKIENSYRNIRNIVKLEQSNSTNPLFKEKYRKDLKNLLDKSFISLKKDIIVQKKIQRVLKETTGPYATGENIINEKIQMGLSIESLVYKTSFLNSLKGKTINLQARVLNTTTTEEENFLTARIPMYIKNKRTNKILLIYVKAKTKSLKKLNLIRPYQDVQLTIKLKNSKLLESGSFIVIELKGTLKKVQPMGWLGIAAWKSEPAMLPSPVKEEKTEKKKGKKTKSYSKKASTKKSVAKSTAKKSVKPSKTVKSTPKKTNLEDDWQDDSNAFD